MQYVSDFSPVILGNAALAAHAAAEALRVIGTAAHRVMRRLATTARGYLADGGMKAEQAALFVAGETMLDLPLWTAAEYARTPRGAAEIIGWALTEKGLAWDAVAGVSVRDLMDAAERVLHLGPDPVNPTPAANAAPGSTPDPSALPASGLPASGSASMSAATASAS